MTDIQSHEKILQTCLGGRAETFPNKRLVHAYSPLSTAAQVWNPIDQVLNEGGGWDSSILGSFREPRLFQVTSSAVEVIRLTAAPTAPLSNSELMAQLETGQFGANGGTSVLSLMVNVVGDDGTKSFFMDIGQSVDVYATRVAVGLVSTAGAFSVTHGDTRTLAANLLVADTYVGVAINPIESSRNPNQVRLKQIVSATANNPAVFTVPRYATRVSISQNAAGGLPGAAERFVGDPRVLAARQVGTIDFVGRNANDVVLGGETHIRTNTDAAARVYEATWTLLVQT